MCSKSGLSEDCDTGVLTGRWFHSPMSSVLTVLLGQGPAAGVGPWSGDLEGCVLVCVSSLSFSLTIPLSAYLAVCLSLCPSLSLPPSLSPPPILAAMS